jgi:hypothetical protein
MSMRLRFVPECSDIQPQSVHLDSVILPQKHRQNPSQSFIYGKQFSRFDTIAYTQNDQVLGLIL